MRTLTIRNRVITGTNAAAEDAADEDNLKPSLLSMPIQVSIHSQIWQSSPSQSCSALTAIIKEENKTTTIIIKAMMTAAAFLNLSLLIPAFDFTEQSLRLFLILLSFYHKIDRAEQTLALMKILVIPDVHLKPEIFDRADRILSEGKAERAVCLMDIPDDWEQELNISLYERTWDRAIRFQKDHPDTLWCYGNHDLSYVWERLETGFSTYAISTVTSKINKLKSILPSLDQIAYIHRIDNVLFLHGGLTESFVKLTVNPGKWSDPDKVIRAVNKLNADIMWSEGSPIWFRPQYSDEPMFMESELIQVVGHTPVYEVNRNGSVISCDVFSTHRDGSNIGTCEFPVIDTLTCEFESI